MKWTKQQPRTPGWYWLRSENEFGPSERIVLVEQEALDASCWFFYEDDALIYFGDSRVDDADWSDEPIPEPEA